MARVCSRGVTMFGLIRGRAERGVAYMVRQALPWCGLHAVVRFKLPRSHPGVCPPKNPYGRTHGRIFMLVHDPSSNEYDASHV